MQRYRWMKAHNGVNCAYWYNSCHIVMTGMCYDSQCTNSDLLFFLLSKWLDDFQSLRTGGICPYKSQKSKQSLNSLLIRNWLKVVHLTKLYKHRGERKTALTAQLWAVFWSDRLLKSPSEIRDKSSEERLCVLMLPFVFWIASHTKKCRADTAQRILTRLWIFFMFSSEGKKGRRRELEAYWEVQRNTATQREKLPIKTADHWGPITNTCSYCRQENYLQNISKLYFSNMLFGLVRSERVRHYRRTKQTGGEVKHLKCSTISKSSVPDY